MNQSEMEARGSKTLVATDPMREPSWLVWTVMKLFRLIFLSVLWAGLGMGIGLFLGIVITLGGGLIHHQNPDMSQAYRLISIPVAIATGSSALLWNLFRTLQAAAARVKGAK